MVRRWEGGYTTMRLSDEGRNTSRDCWRTVYRRWFVLVDNTVLLESCLGYWHKSWPADNAAGNWGTVTVMYYLLFITHYVTENIVCICVVIAIMYYSFVDISSPEDCARRSRRDLYVSLEADWRISTCYSDDGHCIFNILFMLRSIKLNLFQYLSRYITNNKPVWLKVLV